MRLEIDQHTSGIERDVGSVDTDERGQADDIGILEDGGGERLLALGHGRKGDRLRGLGDGLDQSGVLHREKSLGDDEIEGHRDGDGRRRDDERQALAVEHPVQRAAIDALHAAVRGTGRRFAALRRGRRTRLQELGAHHRHERQRHHGRDDDRHRERDGEFMEKPADHVAHEQQRDENCDQRDGQRYDREADLLGALQRRLQRRFAHFQEARDVLDHHDGIVDDEAGGDRQRHQRQIVEAEAEKIHGRERADERQRDRQARDHGRRNIAQEEKDHQHDEPDRQDQFELHIRDRCADRRRAVGERRHSDGGRQGCLQLRQEALDRVDDLDDVGAGLTLNVQDHRIGGVHPGVQLGVLRRLFDRRDVGEPHRRTVLIGDDGIVVGVGTLELIIGIDRVGLLRPVEISLWRVDVQIADRGAQIVEIEPISGERLRIGADADARPLSATDADEADAGDLRDFFGQPRLGETFDIGQLQRARRDRQRQDGRVGGIDLGIDRRCGQIGGQQISGGIDGGLNLLLGDIEADVEAEAQGDHRCAGGAFRRHLIEARHLTELHLERCRDRRGHDLRTGARIEGLHLDRRIIDFRQGGKRQKAVSDDADEQDRRHQQGRCDRTKDEDTRGTQRIPASGRAASLALRCTAAAAILLLRLRVRRRRRLSVAVADDDPGAVAQPVGSVDHHFVAD